MVSTEVLASAKQGRGSERIGKELFSEHRQEGRGENNCEIHSNRTRPSSLFFCRSDGFVLVCVCSCGCRGVYPSVCMEVRGQPALSSTDTLAASSGLVSHWLELTKKAGPLAGAPGIAV